MSTTTTLPNMNLEVPVVGSETGPQWATDINNCFNTLDQHDHSSGSGVQITPSGLNILTDLTFQNNSATNLKALVLTAQASFATKKSLYVIGNEVYFRDGTGAQVQITNGGSVNAGAGSITGLPSGTASVTYSAVGQSYTFQSATLTPAYLDGASIRIRNLSASSKMVQLDPPAAMAADTTITLPTIPASTKIMTMDAAGAMSANYITDNSTLEVSSNTLRIKDSGVIAAKIANGNVTLEKLSAASILSSASCGQFITSSTSYVDVTNLSFAFTVSGLRPVEICLISDGSTGLLQEGGFYHSSSNTNAFSYVQLLRNSTVLSRQAIGKYGGTNTGIVIPASSVRHIDQPSAGTYTWKVQVCTDSASTSLITQYMKLIVREIY